MHDNSILFLLNAEVTLFQRQEEIGFGGFLCYYLASTYFKEGHLSSALHLGQLATASLRESGWPVNWCCRDG